MIHGIDAVILSSDEVKNINRLIYSLAIDLYGSEEAIGKLEEKASDIGVDVDFLCLVDAARRVEKFDTQMEELEKEQARGGIKL